MPDPDLPSPYSFSPAPAQEILDRLEAAVHAAGGRALTARHESRPVLYKDTPRPNVKPSRTAACGNETLLDVPYETPDGGTAYARVCAMCDGVYLHPRWGVVD